MADRDELVERVRRSVELTATEGTARIRFAPRRSVGRSLESVLTERSSKKSLAVFGVAKRVVRRGLAVIPPSSSESGVAAGQIDFGQRRSVYNAGTSWRLVAPGRDFLGQPGEWAAGEHDGILLDEPFWLLELIKSTVEAVGEETDWVRGVECRRHRATADFGLAATSAERAMARPPDGSGEGDVARLTIDVWLDTSGRIRRADLQGSGSMTTLECFDFGEPLPIELPKASEILPARPSGPD